ncbi:hypothetical protein N7474_006351 [Penicillium riverlandense]|uniref:uncharacterized protein n=1 Tax=Penicillium riverlandense TaxID=1903569 RepID=UPI0025498785|nr:uncharacterized protein N7474_006351 [Penicillium riverlandense]KAJ5814574.1 hypothetical protein N7474_006351 [Penicillium riverlandense]
MLLNYFTATTLLAATGTLAWSRFSDSQDPSTTIIKEPNEGAATLVKAAYGDDIYYCFAQLILAWGCNGISDTPIGKYQDGTCVPLNEGNAYEISTICHSAKIALFYNDMSDGDVKAVEPVDVDFNWVLDSPKAGFLYFVDENNRGEVWSPLQQQDAQTAASYVLGTATPEYLYFTETNSHSHDSSPRLHELV